MRPRRMELAVFEGLESVQGDRLAQRTTRAVFLVEEQAMSPEPGSMGEDGLGRDVIPSGDLPEARARDQAMEDLRKQLGTL